MALDGVEGYTAQPRKFTRLLVSKFGREVTGQIYCEPMTARPTGLVEGRIGWDDAANGLVQCDGSAYRSLADRHIIRTELVAASVDKWVFVADRAYKVLAVREIHSVAGGSAAAIAIRKVTAAGTDAPGAAASATVKEILAATIDLTATANVAQSPALHATAANYTLAVGDKIGIDFSGTLTGLVGDLTIYLEQV